MVRPSNTLLGLARRALHASPVKTAGSQCRDGEALGQREMDQTGAESMGMPPFPVGRHVSSS